MKQDLKKELHSIIDAIDDEETLGILKEDLALYASVGRTDGLSHEQLSELDKAIKESDDESDLKDWQSLKKELENKWRER